MKREYEIITALLDPNIYSRPQSKILGIRGVCIHWVANPKSTAINNRHYFNNLPAQNKRNRELAEKEGKKFTARYASSHEIIGLDGEVVVAVPSDEVAFHAGATTYKTRVKQLLASSPNRYLYGIEVCHPDSTGEFSDITYKVIVNRVADLLIEFDLRPNKDTIWRHFDVTGKDCPRYYMQNEGAWEKLIDDVFNKYYEKIKKKTDEVIKMTLAKWQEEMGNKSLESLNKKKDKDGNPVVNSPEDWKKSLGDNVPQWLFWSIIDRITK